MDRRRLSAVLRVRALQERGAKGDLARCNQQLRRAEHIEQTMWHDLDTAAATTTGVVDFRTLRGLEARSSSGRLAAERQHEHVEQAEVAVTESHAVWSLAAQRVAALERLAERLDAAHLEESLRLAANELDDAVLARRSSTASTTRSPGAAR
jgi:flagellar biosynthesis chaperone FliJ